MMGMRSAVYRVSDGVRETLSQEEVEEVIKRTVDKAYERNLMLTKESSFMNRFVMPTVNGKLVSNATLVKAIKNQQEIGKLLIIACLWEEKGEDMAHVVLQSELEANRTAGHPMTKEMEELIDSPPHKFPWEE